MCMIVCDVLACYGMIFIVIFDSASDICDLKIVKDVADAKSLVNARGRQYNGKPRDAPTAANAPHSDRRVCRKAQDIVSFEHSVSDTSLPNTRNTENSKGSDIASGFKPASAASPRKTSVKASSNCKKSQNVVAVDSRSSPYKKQTNGFLQNRQRNGILKVKGYDASRISGCSPDDLTSCVQMLTVSDEMVNTTDCLSESNQRNISRKRTNSGMACVEDMLLNFTYIYLNLFIAFSSSHRV